MQITPVRDQADLEAFHAVRVATFDHDFVALTADGIEELVPLLSGEPMAGELTRLFVARDGDQAVGALEIRLPLLDNLSTANVDGSVLPSARRRGHGRALLDFALAEVRREGRDRVFLEAAWARDGSPGLADHLLRSVGARPVLDDVRRLLDVRATPLAAPAPVPGGYRLEQWTDRAPEELVDGCAYLNGRMILDAPMGEMDYEQEKWDAARYRAAEQAAMARGRRRVVTAVVHEESGGMAGITEIGMARGRDDVAYQWDTIVDPDHRGHGLGLVLKSWNHRYLLDAVPTLQHINTWNAASNTFMIAVNEALGFQVAETWSEWQLDL